MNIPFRSFLLPVAAMAALLSACSSHTGSDTLYRAEMAIEKGDFAGAKALCDKAMEAEDLRGTELARASLVYIKVADNASTDDGETMGLAVNAYERALEADPDSVGLFLSRVDADDTRHVKMLLNIVHGLELPDSALVDEP